MRSLGPATMARVDPTGPIVLVVGFFALFGLIFFLVWWFSKEQKIRRALRNVRPTPIGQVREGLVKISGACRPLNVLRAPLSGRACAYYEVLVEQKVSSGKSSHWRTIIREVEERDFVVEDGTGRARIEMVAIEAAVTRDGHWSSGTFNDASPELEAFLNRHGHGSEGWIFNKTLRYREGVIEPGEQVAVLGWAEREIDPEPGGAGHGFRDPASRVVLRGNGVQPLRVSDDPGTLG